MIKGYMILPFQCKLYSLQMSIHAYVNTYKISMHQRVVIMNAVSKLLLPPFQNIWCCGCFNVDHIQTKMSELTH